MRVVTSAVVLRAVVCAAPLVLSVSNALLAQTPASTARQRVAGSVDIDAVLRQPATANFSDAPLPDVAQQLSKAHGVSIRLDRKALTDAGINARQTRITRKHGGVTLAQLLRLVLSELDLTYVAQDSGLLITTPERAGGELEVRVYPVRDLISPHAKDGELAVEGSMDYDSLIEMIASTIAPTSWDEGSGPSPLAAFRGTLVIEQTAEVHEQISRLLAALRQAIRGWNSKQDITPVVADPEN
jgi:hypothetical protein